MTGVQTCALPIYAKAPLNCGYGEKCGFDRAVQGICPDGWHLPSIYEWGLLSVALGGASVSGKPLKALTGWNYSSTGYNNGTDLYGFAALPTGRRISATSWEKVGSDVYYWSATEQESYYGRYFNINNVYTNSYTSQDYKSYGQSVRCVKGDPSTAPVRPSSSSSVTSVSSSSVPEGYVDPSSVVTGTMTDSRDGKVYKTVQIGTQTWMAENLNYAYTGVPYKYKDNTSDSTSWCYDNDPANCAKYGRLYTWSAAMDSVGTWSANGKGCGYGVQCTPTYPVRGICPEGWHLPNDTEWDTLFVAVGGLEVAGNVLRSQTGWDNNGNGTDAFGFSALPAGYRYNYEGQFLYAGSEVHFWTSLDRHNEFVREMKLDVKKCVNWCLDDEEKSVAISVRCIKD